MMAPIASVIRIMTNDMQSHCKIGQAVTICEVVSFQYAQHILLQMCMCNFKEKLSTKSSMECKIKRKYMCYIFSIFIKFVQKYRNILHNYFCCL